MGRGNQLLSRLSRQNFLAWESSRPFFPQANTQVVGLPLSTRLTDNRSPRKKSARPVILVTGGKQGAHSLNQATFAIIPQLVQHYTVIHQTGQSLHTADIRQAEEIKTSLPESQRSRYQPHAFLTTNEMITSLQQSAVVVSRAGAHICYELLALGKPAVLIPLPFSFNQEQQKNALVLKQAGIATILGQSQLTAASLWGSITAVFAHSSQFASAKKTAQHLILPHAQDKIIHYLID